MSTYTLKQNISKLLNIDTDKDIHLAESKDGKSYPTFNFNHGKYTGCIDYYGKEFILVKYTDKPNPQNWMTTKCFTSEENVINFLNYRIIQNNDMLDASIPVRDEIKILEAGEVFNKRRKK